MVAISLLVKAREKFPDLNNRLTREAMGSLGERLRDGKISAAKFRDGMEKELRDGVVAGYRFSVGHKLTDDDLARVGAILDRQAEHLDGFMDAIAANEPGDWIPARAQLYAGATTEAAAEGKLAGEDDIELEWTGPDGDASCDDCAALIGTVRTAAEWARSDDRPGQMQCGGNCRCSLEAA